MCSICSKSYSNIIIFFYRYRYKITYISLI
nr:MAG TPA: zinc-finger double domain protein [Crassvirales sp.]